MDTFRIDSSEHREAGHAHVATALALAACRQGHRVRFYSAAGLVNELIRAQSEHQLSKFLATALRHRLIVLVLQPQLAGQAL
ncbi:MAG TPA: ATP-binding protein [Anaerolineae bacterium]|nr:ATP-binding protein [Anaerolineae bacterium]